LWNLRSEARRHGADRAAAARVPQPALEETGLK
jgi:hypothetical protein